MSNGKTVKIQVKETNWGEQYSLTIPRQIAELFELEKGDEVEFKKNSGRIKKGLVIQKKED